MSNFRGLKQISFSAIRFVDLAYLVGLVVTMGVASAQCSADPEFEVAATKVVGNRYGARPQVDAGRVNYPFVTLTALILRAYSLKGYQLDGPDWLRTAHYEILAKIPESCSTKEIPGMLRHLLQERFKLEVHEELREQSAYALVVDRNGPKLKKSDPATPDAGIGTVPASTVAISSSGHLKFRRATLGQLADALSGSLGKPVLDMTGIDGEYDIDLDVDPPQALRISAGNDAIPEQIEPVNTPIHAGLRELGLRLTPHRARVRHTIIDRIEKIPVAN